MWCPHTDSNREPIDYKSIALPIELWGLGGYLSWKTNESNLFQFWMIVDDVHRVLLKGL